MRRAAVVGVLVAASLACGNTNEVQGVVIEVDGTLTSVASFVLRTDSGEVITVVPAEDGDFAFPLAHLNDHRVSLSPIVVELDRSVDPPLARSIRDADSPVHG